MEHALCLISGIRRNVHEIFALLGRYVAYIGGYLLTFRDHLSMSSSRVKQLLGCSVISVINYNSALCNIPEERKRRLLYVTVLARRILRWPLNF
jgi:hypothetical protein